MVPTEGKETANMTTTTTPGNVITTAQIRALRSEAVLAGDYVTADYCGIALAYSEHADDVGAELVDPVTGNPITRSQAREVCADAIRAAAAMAG